MSDAALPLTTPTLSAVPSDAPGGDMARAPVAAPEGKQEAASQVGAPAAAPHPAPIVPMHPHGAHGAPHPAAHPPQPHPHPAQPHPHPVHITPPATAHAVEVDDAVFDQAKSSLDLYFGKHIRPAFLKPKGGEELSVSLQNRISTSGVVGNSDLTLRFSGSALRANTPEISKEAYDALISHPAVVELKEKMHPMSINISQFTTDDNGTTMTMGVQNLTAEQYASFIHALAKPPEKAAAAHVCDAACQHEKAAVAAAEAPSAAAEASLAPVMPMTASPALSPEAVQAPAAVVAGNFAASPNTQIQQADAQHQGMIGFNAAQGITTQMGATAGQGFVNQLGAANAAASYAIGA